MSLILGLETSCDETAASVVKDGQTLLSNVVSTQHDLHKRFGGVVPEIASRAHLQRLWPVVCAAIDQAKVDLTELDAIAVGNRPGLIGSLIVGASAAKALAWSLGIPLIGIDHVQAHLYAAALQDTPAQAARPTPQAPSPKPLFPALGLVVSGGHTSIYKVTSPIEMKLLGRTIDDAVGEAYDKAAVILQAGYPGGPNLDKLAQQGDPAAHKLPRPMLGPDSLDFSFSGLKTALLYATRGHPLPRNRPRNPSTKTVPNTPRSGRGNKPTFARDASDLTQQQRADLAASFQAAVVDTLITKLRRAIKHLSDSGPRPNALIVGGGVSANSLLRQRVQDFGQRESIPVCIPPLDLCVDNAAMIAGLAHTKLVIGDIDDLSLPVIATTAMV